mgnify:CR=1 FL=1
MNSLLAIALTVIILALLCLPSHDWLLFIINLLSSVLIELI